MDNPPDQPKTLRIPDLLRPHSRALALAAIAAIGEGIANLLEPVPLKIVLDNVLKSQPAHGWLNRVLLSISGPDKLAALKFAAAAVLVIAVVDAICSYTEKSLTTSVGQWVTHDLRQTLYLQ